MAGGARWVPWARLAHRPVTGRRGPCVAYYPRYRARALAPIRSPPRRSRGAGAIALPRAAARTTSPPAPTAIVWYTAQRAGAARPARPGHRQGRAIALGAGSAPHGVIIGPDGAPWITDGGTNAIVRVDPATREVTRWPLPEARGYANLNTATFDKRGRASGSPARTGSTAGSIPTSGDDAGLGRAARPRPLRHHDHAATATSTTPRSRAATSRASTSRPARRPSIEPPTQGPGRAARLVRLPRPDLGQRVERGPGRAATTRATSALEDVEAARANGRAPTRSTSTSGTRCG